MATALLAEPSGFEISPQTGGAVFKSNVLYETTTPNVFTQSAIQFMIAPASETGATFQAKLLSAINTEAARLSLPNPTTLYGGALAKFL